MDKWSYLECWCCVRDPGPGHLSILLVFIGSRKRSVKSGNIIYTHCRPIYTRSEKINANIIDISKGLGSKGSSEIVSIHINEKYMPCSSILLVKGVKKLFLPDSGSKIKPTTGWKDVTLKYSSTKINSYWMEVQSWREVKTFYLRGRKHYSVPFFSKT